jgi:hypothetical protein
MITTKSRGSLGRHSFKLNDAARLVRALKAAGLSISRVELDNGNHRRDRQQGGGRPQARR